VEVDVRETKDHALVLMHDATVDRTTKASGSVAEMTLGRLERVTLNDDTRITPLSRDLRAIKDSSIKVMLEIKSIKSDEGFTSLARRVRDFGVDRVVVTSFKAHLLDSMREIAPEVALSLITAERPTIDQAVAYGSVSVYYHRIRRHWLHRMRSHGYAVYAWTLNAKTSWARWNGRVSAITTDEAIRFSKWRKNAPCPRIPEA
jgi:glycerophosphoryl diester phosphodiesterase